MEHYVIILSLAVAIVAGLAMSKVVKYAGLPAVTGYLIAGILIGPYCLGLVGVDGIGFTSYNSVKAFSVISEVALGFIAFTIGNEFRLNDLKKVGKQAVVVSIFEALSATLVVDVALIIVYSIVGEEVLPLSAAITLGAIAAATAPAATLMVVRQYKAKGPVTKILLPVVALDDAIALMVFAISFGIAKSFVGEVNVLTVLVEPMLEIVFSLVIGAIFGVVLSFASKLFKDAQLKLALAIGFTFLTIAISMIEFDMGVLHIGFSSLLACMMLGTIYCNMCQDSAEVMESVDRWTSPLFVLFFVLSGAELQLDVFLNVTILIIGFVYLLSRCVGKYLGAFAGSLVMRCEPQVKKYLGVTLFPQAGVALGMSLNALAIFPPYEGQLIRNIVLFGVLIYELLGPMLTKMSLLRAGEIDPNLKQSNTLTSKFKNIHIFKGHNN